MKYEPAYNGCDVLCFLLTFGAVVLPRSVGTTGTRTKIGVPAGLINQPGPVWQGEVIRTFGWCVQHKDIVWSGSLFPLRLVHGLGQLLPDQFTLPYFADNFA